jgi:hypothetical protein
MATNSEEALSLLKDMNGNSLREGDLVMVLLEKPVLVGFIAEIREPSVLTSRDKNPMGVMTVKGQISIPFNPKQIQFLRQTAKLVDPRAEALVAAIAVESGMGAAGKKENGTSDPKATGPTLVPTVVSPVDVDPRTS